MMLTRQAAASLNPPPPLPQVLYQAKLHPDLPSNSLSPEASLELRRCLNHVLEEGCRRNGETFPEHWLFNYRSPLLPPWT